jgi:hypothetical protein
MNRDKTEKLLESPRSKWDFLVWDYFLEILFSFYNKLYITFSFNFKRSN